MAAGLSLSQSRLSEFTEALNLEVKRMLGAELPGRELVSDGGLRDAERTLANAQLLATVSPWGQDFPAPQFDDLFLVESTRPVGVGHLKLRLRSSSDGEHEDYGDIYEAIAFNQSDRFNKGDEVRVVYALSVNHYRGNQSLQLQVAHMQINSS